jgi:hypothetical protein
MHTLGPNHLAIQPAPRSKGDEIDTARAINEARRKREQSARFQELCRQSREWQARYDIPVVVEEAQSS